MNERNWNYSAIAVAAASWGTWSVFLRKAEAGQSLPPALSTFIVLATIGAVLLPLAIVERRRAARRSARDWLLVGAFGVSDAVNCSLYFAALRATSVTVATLTHDVAPLLVSLAAPLLLREAPKPGTGSAVGVGASGFVRAAGTLAG